MITQFDYTRSQNTPHEKKHLKTNQTAKTLDVFERY